jgi:hypothetical protein
MSRKADQEKVGKSKKVEKSFFNMETMAVFEQTIHKEVVSDKSGKSLEDIPARKAWFELSFPRRKPFKPMLYQSQQQ